MVFDNIVYNETAFMQECVEKVSLQWSIVFHNHGVFVSDSGRFENEHEESIRNR